MMRPKTMIPLIAGLGIGFVAVKMGLDMVRHAQATQERQTAVVVSASQIEPTAQIRPEMLGTRQVPQSLVPPGAFTSATDVAGRVTRTMIPKGMVLSEALLAPAGTTPGLQSRIPDGYRAVAVKVDEASSVAGFITPGSRVDVSAVETERQGRDTKVRSRIILRNVEVGAVGQSLNTVGPDGKSARLSRSVTLLLRPEDVPTIQLAASRGRIHLALRNGQDGRMEETREAAERAKDMFASFWKQQRKVEAAKKVAAAPKPTTPHVVEVYRGLDKVRVIFQDEVPVENLPVTKQPNPSPNRASSPDERLLPMGDSEWQDQDTEVVDE